MKLCLISGAVGGANAGLPVIDLIILLIGVIVLFGFLALYRNVKKNDQAK